MTTNTDTNEKHPSPLSSQAIIPVLVYEDIEAGHDYLIETYGFTSGGVFRDGDGTVVHAEVRMGDAAVWLHRVSHEHEMTTPKGAALVHGGLELLVPDVDAHYARSLAAGATVDRQPTDQAYGLREYGARDPENHRWWFSSPLDHD